MPKIKVVLRKTVTTVTYAIFEDEVSQETYDRFQRKDPDPSVWATESLAPGLPKDAWKAAPPTAAGNIGQPMNTRVECMSWEFTP